MLNKLNINKIHFAIYIISILISIASIFMRTPVNISFKNDGFIIPVITMTLIEVNKFVGAVGLIGVVSSLVAGRYTDDATKEKSKKFESTTFCICIAMLVMGIIGVIMGKGVC